MPKIKITPPEKKTIVVESGKIPMGNDPIRDQLDARDNLMSFIGQGYTGGKMSDDQRGQLAQLSNILGADKAHALLSHVAIFNQNPQLQGKSPAERMQRYFNTNPNNPEIAATLARFKSLGSGIGGAINDSPWQGLAATVGRGLPTNQTPTEGAKQVKLLVQNTVK